MTLYITEDNPDDSGRVAYSATTPVAGLLLRAGADWHLYASFGRGFETPTFNELAYRADGGAGLAFNLKPARSGMAKSVPNGAGRTMASSMSRCSSRTPATNSPFTAAAAGALRTRTSAARAGVDSNWDWMHRWQRTCARKWLIRCWTHVSRKLPDASTAIAPSRQARASPACRANSFTASCAGARSSGWHAGLNLFAVGAVYADDANAARAPGYGLLGADFGYVARMADATVAPFIRFDNLFDRRAIGSVIVNSSNGGYFESAPGRSVMAD